MHLVTEMRDRKEIKMKNAVFFDIDGTLWDENLYIPESTIEGIHNLQEAGNLAFLCTGRSRGYVQNKKLLSLGFDGVVAGCGTYIEDKNGKILMERLIEPERAKEIMQVLEEHRVPVVYECRDGLYMEMELMEKDPFYQMLIKDPDVTLKEVKEHREDVQMSKFSVAITNMTDYQWLLQAFAEDFVGYVHGNMAIEYVPKGFSKAVGIQNACRLYDVDLKNTYAIGDSVNDVEMLKFANVGICMGNGTEDAKAVADFVTKPLKEGGISHALSHFSLI